MKKDITMEKIVALAKNMRIYIPGIGDLRRPC